MSVAVNVVCRNYFDDRVIPRFSRYLSERLGWTLTATPQPAAGAYYLSSYLEAPLFRRWPTDKPVAAYFTHLETEPPGTDKARQFHQLAERVDLRIATAAMYARLLEDYGPTVQIKPPVERDHFTVPANRNKTFAAGFSGYTYSNGRKGERLAKQLVSARPGEWRASGRGWPARTRRYTWADLPGFYQSLDVLVVTALVEGVPMPPLEALACGVSVVIPRGVGLLDELPDVVGIHRYAVGDGGGLMAAFDEAKANRPEVNREALRAVTEPYTIAGWVEGHRRAFEQIGEQPMEKVISGSDAQIVAAVAQVWPDVHKVLAWTGKRIPYIKRQVAPYQGAILAYYAHTYNRPGARFLEIGTALGYSACVMATAAPLAQIVTLNPKEGEYQKAVKNLAIRSNVQVEKLTSREFYSASGVGSYDLIFVDGDHAYREVLHDAQFFNRLKTGGLIIFHDYSPDGSARPSHGSYRALNHLQKDHRAADVKIIGSGNVGMLGWMRREGETWD